jgi:glycosyltransferase involved in cell wall biosynthesis
VKLITVVTPCFNEMDNIVEIYNQVKSVFAQLPNYKYKHLFIDNASTDESTSIIKGLIKEDSNVQLIVNKRNFGHIRSPYYGLLQAEGDAAILIAADLQEPPELIKDFIGKWEEGYQVALGVKHKSKESRLFSFVRKVYYYLVSRMSEVHLIKHCTGFGLYDRSALQLMRQLDESYPYLRGLISDLGLNFCEIKYTQPLRMYGISKNNFLALYDMAMLGFTSHAKTPLRLVTFCGFFIATISFFISITYLILKLFFWNSFKFGLAPLLIGVFFFSAIQLFSLGFLGEYILHILTLVKKRPLVIEKERVNFENTLIE